MKAQSFRGSNLFSSDIKRDRVRLGLLLAFSFTLAFLGRYGSLDLMTLRPAFASIGAVRLAVEGEAARRESAERSIERERGARAISENALLRDRAELFALREIFKLDRPDTNAWRLVRVLGVIPSRGERHLLLDRGSEAGIHPGAAVAASTKWGLAFAGRVVESSHGVAKVLAVTDPSSSIPVTVPGQGSGLLFQGGYPKLFGRLLYLPTVGEPKLKEVVRLADISSAAGTLVGWIWKIDRTATSQGTSLFSNVEVLPAVDVDELKFVWVEISHGQ